MRIMHNNLPAEYFDIFGSPYASDFTWYYVMAVVVMNLLGSVVQPHSLPTGGGSAKDELSARTGYMVGNLLKRFCTILWSFSTLAIIVLYSVTCTPAVNRVYFLPERLPAKPEDYPIRLYFDQLPECEYQEIGMITSRQRNKLISMDAVTEALRCEARKMGGDAVINVR